MFGVNAPVSARVPRVTDAFPQSHNSPPDSCMVLPHFPSNPVLVAVISCSSTAQTVFNTQKNTFISKPQSTFWLYLSRPSKNKRYLQDCKTNTFSARSVTLLLCLLFSLLTTKWPRTTLLSPAWWETRSIYGPIHIKIQEMVNVFYFYHYLELCKPHLDTAR